MVGVHLDVEPGDTIREVRSSQDRAGSVVARADDAPTAASRASGAAAPVRFEPAVGAWTQGCRHRAAVPL